jgi:hypothetical protein
MYWLPDDQAGQKGMVRYIGREVGGGMLAPRMQEQPVLSNFQVRMMKYLLLMEVCK